MLHHLGSTIIIIWEARLVVVSACVSAWVSACVSACVPQGHCDVFLRKTLYYHSAGELNAGGNPAMTNIPSRGGEGEGGNTPSRFMLQKQG